MRNSEKEIKDNKKKKHTKLKLIGFGVSLLGTASVLWAVRAVCQATVEILKTKKSNW